MTASVRDGGEELDAAHVEQLLDEALDDYLPGKLPVFAARVDGT